MPLNKPPLPLEPDPRSVQSARRWIGSVLRELGREDLLECAELGISELVTNALLHAEDPISVKVRGTRHHPRIEVTDGSRRPPELPRHPRGGIDDLLTTFGRGLELVARCAVAWGATIEPDGKVVWFEPAAAAHEAEPPAGSLYSDEPAVRSTSPDGYDVHLRGLSVPILLTLRQHYRELRREVRLLSMAHPETYPLATELTRLFSRFEAAFPPDLSTAVDHADLTGKETIDVATRITQEVPRMATQMVELMEMADEFCRAQRLLALSRTDEQRAFQEWMLGEFVRQAAGAEPIPWTGDGSGRPSSPGAAGNRVTKFVS